MPTVTVEEIHKAFEDFKTRNDARLAEVEKFGEATAETQAAANRANEAVTELQAKVTANEAQRAEDRATIDALEVRLNRERAGGGIGGRALSEEKRLRYARFQGAVQSKERVEVDPANVDLNWIAAYQAAFYDYIKHGEARASKDSLDILNSALAGDNPSGGFYVEPDMDGRIVEFLYETSPIRSLANVQVTSGDRLNGKVQLGEAGFGWVGETEARPETDTTSIFEWEVPLREMYAAPRASQRIIDQASIDIGGWIEGNVRRKFGRAEATAFVSGSTPKRPRGFTTYTAGTPGDTAATWPLIEQVASGHATLLTADGLHALVASLFPEYLPNATFGMRRATELVIRQMKDGVGNYLWQPDFSAPAKGQLLGYPVVLMADMPAIGAGAEPIVFADFFEAYQIVDSPIGTRVLVDPYTAKPYTVFYTTRYVGGDVVNFQAIKLQTVSA